MQLEKTFINYFIFASIASLVDIGLLYFLTEFFGFFYIISATFSFIFAQLLNYYLNKKFNFQNEKRKIKTTKKQAIIFIFVNTIGLFISLVILFILVEFFGLWYIFAKIFSMLVAVNFNYYFHKNYTFA